MKAIYDTPLPDGWVEESVAKVVVTRRGYTWEKADEVERAESDTIPVVRIPNVQEALDLQDVLHLRNVSPEAVQKAAVTKGWLLFVGSNGTQNRIGDSVLMDEDRPMVFASFLVGIQPKDQGQLRSDFFAHWMRLHLVHEVFSKTSQQTTGLANFSWGAVKRLPVRFPACAEEQRRIAAALRRADEAIQVARAESKAARELRKSAALELLEKGMPLRHINFATTKHWTYPMGWELVRVKDLISDMDAGSSPMCESEPAKQGQWGVLKVSAVSWDRFEELENKALPSTIEPEISAEVHVGDIIVSRANTTEFCGAVHRVHSLYTRLLLCDKTWRLHPKNDVNPDWLVAALKHPAARKQIEANSTGTSDSMKNIAKRDFRNVVVPRPGKGEQNEIANVLNAIDVQVEAHEQKVSALREVKQSLLHELLTGKVRIPEGAVHA